MYQRQVKNIVELLRERAEIHPERVALRMLADGESAAAMLSYAELDTTAIALATALQARVGAGERALIVLPTGTDYVNAFLGCLYAGVIAVPAHPPESSRSQFHARLHAIAADATPRLILTQQSLLETVAAALAELLPALEAEVMAVDHLIGAPAEAQWRMPSLAADAVAFLQYTSGSTATPKGVIVGHDNLMANERAIQRGFRIGDEDAFVSWLPLYHDMGLVGGLLQPLFSGIAVTLMSPRHFLERPVRWLEAVARYGGTVSGGPDFAFRLCVDRIGEAMTEELDLSSWRVAFCGAEPIRHATMQGFAARFAPAGLSPKALYPCYGLAEATLIVTGGTPGEGVRVLGASHDDAECKRDTSIIDCGYEQAEHAVAIVDGTSGEPMPQGTVGEIQVSGPSIALGYWCRPDASADTFVERAGRRWLRTGDLGLLDAGRLYVTGRLKDLIVICGQNLYPQDIERVIEQEVELIRVGRVAAFAIVTDAGEGIGIAAEVSRNVQKQTAPEVLFERISQVVASRFHEPVAGILLLQPGTLPKTTSGKLQRSACARGWRDGSLHGFARYDAAAERPDGAASDAPYSPTERRIAAIWRELLRLPQVGLGDNFFGLGGQSITAVEVCGRLTQDLGFPVETRRLFEAACLREFAADLDRIGAIEPVPPMPPITTSDATDRLPLSAGQQSLYVLWSVTPASAAYHMAGAVRLTGRVDAAAVRWSFEQLAARHEQLRTTFHAADGQPYQRIAPGAVVAWRELDLSGVADTGWDEAERQAQSAAEARAPFDLEQGPLWRVSWVRLGPETHELWLTVHHLIGDGGSLQRLLDEFAQLYTARCAGQAAGLPPLPLRYVDYALWQRAWLESGEGERQLGYWTERLGGEPAPELLPTVPAESDRAGRWPFTFSGSLSAAVQARARAAGVTPVVVLLAAFKAVLYRLSGVGDIRIGVPLANRQRSELAGLVGYFVNTVVFRTGLHGALTGEALLARVRETAIGAHSHPDLPFEQLVEALRPERSADRNPLFQVMYNHQRRDLSGLERGTGLSVTAIARDSGAAQFDLSLDTEEDGHGSLSGFFTYAAEKLSGDWVARLAADYQTLLQALVSEPNRRLGAIELLGSAERSQLTEWNRCETGYDGAVRIPDLIARWAEHRPEAVAVVGQSAAGEPETYLTYRELDVASNRLAWQLRDAAVGPETLVALRLPRGVEFLVAVLGVWKAGGAFVPVDPEAPGARVRELLTQAGVRLGLTVAGLPALTADGDACRWLDLTEPQAWRVGPGASATIDGIGQGDHPLPVATHPEQLAYLIHTSGSTGTPKGVAVSHGTVSRHVQAAAAAYGLSPQDGALHFAAFSFDAAIEQWAVPLISGAKLVLGDPGWTGETTLAVLDRHGLNVVYPPLAPALHLAETLAARGETRRLRRLCVGGEAVARASVATLRTQLQLDCLVNGYGPTETVITPLAWLAAPEHPCDSAYAPIGRPLGERTAWVLDGDLNPLPPGVPGELYIGGPLLARGYHQQPGLTAERFVPDPFGPPGSRLYRTGDRVRQRADGVIDFLGRVDEQLKLRGYRIEPGEIEAVLREQPGVREAIVMLHREGGRAQLLGYVAGENLDPARLKAALAARLPAYMVPSQCLVLPALPRTRHGKVDRAALPLPERISEIRIAPRTEAEIRLAAIWQDVLGIDQVGVTDNFFALGGDSILSLQLVSRARADGLTLSPKDVFRYPTLEALAAVAQPHTAAAAFEEGPVTGPVPLTPIQALFFATAIPARHHWNQALLLAPQQPLDAAHLAQALNDLLARHASLRLRYTERDGVWQQAYAEPERESSEDMLWLRPVADRAALEAGAAAAQRSLDLREGPLLRAVLFTYPDGTQRLLLVVHHLVVDGVSWRILLADLQGAYQVRANGNTCPLPPATSSFKAWSQRLVSWAGRAELQAQRDYWLQQVPDLSPRWPCDDHGGSATNRDAATLTLALDPEQTEALLHTAGAAYRTQIQDLLLTALLRAWRRWSGQTHLAVELEGHGRVPLFPELDLSRSLGWFTSLYPLSLSGPDDLRGAIQAVKEQLRQLPDQGLGYGLLRHLGSPDIQAELAARPRPPLTFNYLGQFDASFGREALFQPAPEDAGADRDPAAPLANELELNGEVYGGQLRFSLTYSAARYRTDTVQPLLDAYREELTALIAHCLSPEAGGLTPSDVPLAGLNQAQLEALPLPHRTLDDLYPLSPLQQGLLFHAVQRGEADPYFYQRVFSLTGPLDTERFGAAWNAVLRRHEALRSMFWTDEAGHGFQVVMKAADVEVPFDDWRGIAADDQTGRLVRELARERRLGFEGHAGQTAVRLIRIAEQGCWLVWSQHHIALDGWSTGVVLRDLLRAYHGDTSQAGADSLRDYLLWQTRRDEAKALRFWRDALAGFTVPTPLPLTRSSETEPSESGGYEEHTLRLDPAQTGDLLGAIQRLRVTPSTLLQGAYAVLLGRHADSADVVFGMTVSGRTVPLPHIEDRVGLFINTVPVRVHLAPAQTIADWLHAAQEQAVQRQEHEFTSLPAIQREAEVVEGRGLFDAILVFENYPLDRTLREGSGELRIALQDLPSSAVPIGRNNYPLSLIAHLDSELSVTFSGDRRHFRTGAMAELSAQFAAILTALCAKAASPLGTVALPGGTALIACDEAGVVPPFPDLLAGWGHHLRWDPGAVAVQDERRTVTRAQLDAAAERLAASLRPIAAGSEAVVPVLLDRSVELVAAVLGIMKAGAVYLPLDTRLPAARIRALVESSSARVVVCGDAVPAALRDLGLPLLSVDVSAPPGPTPAVMASPMRPHQAAYAIYTSGSTGEPKRVIVSHGALNGYLQGVLQRLRLTPGARMAMISTPAADLGHTMLFGALYSGRPLHLISSDCGADPDAFARYMAANRVAALKIVPSHLRGLLTSGTADALPDDVLILGGEACPADLVAAVKRLKPACRVINHYGPTETCVGVFTHEIDGAGTGATLPIGRPLPEVSGLVLDRDLNPVPIGVVGELYVAGSCVARGYHQQPGLTAERFLPAPFGPPGGRMYRTGDRVVADGGTLIFLGRADDQIKIRGYRVEPEEVAAALRGIDGIGAAAVVALPDPDADERLRLVAYYVGAGAAATDTEAIRDRLAEGLADYMVPSVFVRLEALPLNANGKLDRSKLPAPEAEARSQVAPRTEAEQTLVSIWEAVLKKAPIGVTDNFFELGGDSILSLQVIARARKAGIRLNPKQLFEHPTIAALAGLGPASPAQVSDRIRRAPLADTMPVSLGQQRLWFLQQLDPDSAAYHIAGGLALGGAVVVDALHAALQTLMQRHEALRTSFEVQNGVPVQRIHEDQGLPFTVIDAPPLAPSARDEWLRLRSHEDARGPFDLEQGPLWRMTLVRTGAEQAELWLTAHHLIADGWSLNRLLDELAETYSAALEGRTAALPPLPIRYADYAVWQRDSLSGARETRLLDFWRARLGDEPPELRLPTDRSPPAVRTGLGAQHAFTLPGGLAARVRTLAQETGATPFAVLMAAFASLLYRHTGTTDLRIGVPVAARERPEVQGVVGFFVNTLVHRIAVTGRSGFRELIARVRSVAVDAQAHAELPFERLVDALQPERTLGTNPLFQVMYSHQRRDFGKLRALPSLMIERIERSAGAAQLDLSLYTEEDEAGRLTGTWVYATDLFDAETIERLHTGFLCLLDQLTAAPDRLIADADVLGDTARAELAGWNATAHAYPETPVHELIRRTAERQPDAVALAFRGETMTYAALERAGNRLAQRLRKLGVGPESRVGVAAERSFELVIGLLAVLKAGGAYVPFDPDYPAERLAYLAEDAAVDVLLVQPAVVARLPTDRGPVRLDLADASLASESDSAPAIAVHTEQLAYVIYTSGSTGRPKGAGNTHAGLANRLQWMQEEYDLGPEDTVLQKTPFSFDVSVWEFFWPLMVGARLALAEPGDHRDPVRLSALIREHRVTTLHFVPSMLQEFVSGAMPGAYPSLRRIVCSGEALSAELRDRALERFPGVDLYNLYGPTEATIDVTHWTCRADDDSRVAIGRPIANTAIHVLDADLNPVPPGVAGELYIAGRGVARGYHGRPGLTAERFVPDRFGPPGARLYRTGDLASRRVDGVIDYLGRIDHQVKLRGFRIELGEIEAQLLAQPGVREAVAVVRDLPGGPRLLAYVTGEEDLPDAEDLRERLRTVLPDYMVPARIMRLTELPRTTSGKLDRRALPAPDWHSVEFEEPQTATEQALARIWSELLGVERIGRADSFFGLGGHSLLAAQLIARIRAEFGVAPPLRAVFETGSLMDLARLVEAEGRSAPALGEAALSAIDELLAEFETG